MKQLESKFIKETNEQYSIREDGKVFKHFRFSPYKGFIFQHKEIKAKNGSVSIYINKKIKGFSIQLLLFNYFGYIICSKCNCKIFVINHKNWQRMCEECKINPKSYIKTKEQNLNNHKYSYLNITKSYAAKYLKLKVEDINDELHNQYKKNLLFKRKVAKENNISINSFK